MRFLRLCLTLLICFTAIIIGVKTLDINRDIGTILIVSAVSIPYWAAFFRNRITKWWALIPSWLLPVEVLLILKLEGTINEIIGTVTLMIVALPYSVIYIIKHKKIADKFNVVYHFFSGSFFVIGLAVIYVAAWLMTPY